MAPNDKIYWHYDLKFDRSNDEALEYQIWRTLTDQGIEDTYDQFT